MTEPQPDPIPEPTAQDLVNALMNVFAFVLPVIEAHCAEFVRTVERLADTVEQLNNAEYYRRTGRKPSPRPVPRPAKDPR